MNEYLEKPDYKYKFKKSACVACGGYCCIGSSGYIWTTSEEQKKISDILKIDIDEFRKEYLIYINGKYSIKELKISDIYYCVFFDTEKKCCSIYDVRPKQCRSFPFWEYYKDKIDLILEECPGIERV
jgi:uncharacterized protein